ncbi:crk-like protein isoform X2 [Anolis carolinensis]|uniref:crk-like protein isoform X2 n=1 Tax=Anolis carolinensis TaxID=28377 RepID=UPI002F2B875C
MSCPCPCPGEGCRGRGAWYAGRLGRREAAWRLQGQRQGTFLVRDSSTCPGDYVLSVAENGRVSHYIIHALPGDGGGAAGRGLFRIGDQHFQSLPDLLDFYRDHYLDTTTLREPLPRGAASPPAPGRPPSLPPEGPEGELVRALYDFAGKDAEDLPFQKGEVLSIEEKPEEQWWRARNKEGRQGMIPVPYVHRLLLPPSKGAAKGAGGRYGIPEPAHAYAQPHGHPAPAPAAPAAQKGPVFAKAIQRRVPCAYDKSALALEVGDLVRVTQMNINGQWEGEIQGRRGLFPFTHVRIINPRNPNEMSSTFVSHSMETWHTTTTTTTTTNNNCSSGSRMGP